MLQLIPAPLHRLLYRMADRVRRRWWRVRKPHRHSVMIVVFDEAGRVLLARHSYGPPVWALPGGGVGRGEDPARTAAREFREELSCELQDLREIRVSAHADSGSRDLRHLFVARLAGAPIPDLREIVEIGWFDPAALPANASKWARTAIGEAQPWRSQQR